MPFPIATTAMLRHRVIASSIAAAIVLSACGPYIRVRTTVAPEATLSAFHTFRVLTPPPRKDGRRGQDDPMLVNSISNQALRVNVTDAFIARGYALSPDSADFTVAYYASTRERLDITMWDYGYRRRWIGWGGVETVATPYTEGTVIVDVVDAKTNDLLWRGRGTARTSDHPTEFQRYLRDAVTAVVKKFPNATSR